MPKKKELPPKVIRLFVLVKEVVVVVVVLF